LQGFLANRHPQQSARHSTSPLQHLDLDYVPQRSSVALDDDGGTTMTRKSNSTKKTRRKRAGDGLVKHMAQLQHNMWVSNARSAVLSIITGGGKWVEMTIHADPLYQHLLLTAEKKFWRCVENGEPPSPVRCRAAPAAGRGGPDRGYERLQLLGGICRHLSPDPPAYQEHESAKADLKKLVPEDAREAIGHGIRAKRSKSGAVSFDLLEMEADHAAL
jgi:hypothetical protein